MFDQSYIQISEVRVCLKQDGFDGGKILIEERSALVGLANASKVLPLPLIREYGGVINGLAEMARGFDRYREPKLLVVEADTISGLPTLLGVLAMTDEHKDVAVSDLVEQNDARQIDGLMPGQEESKAPILSRDGQPWYHKEVVLPGFRREC